MLDNQLFSFSFGDHLKWVICSALVLCAPHHMLWQKIFQNCPYFPFDINVKSCYLFVLCTPPSSSGKSGIRRRKQWLQWSPQAWPSAVQVLFGRGQNSNPSSLVRLKLVESKGQMQERPVSTFCMVRKSLFLRRGSVANLKSRSFQLFCKYSWRVQAEMQISLLFGLCTDKFKKDRKVKLRIIYQKAFIED